MNALHAQALTFAEGVHETPKANMTAAFIFANEASLQIAKGNNKEAVKFCNQAIDLAKSLQQHRHYRTLNEKIEKLNAQLKKYLQKSTFIVLS